MNFLFAKRKTVSDYWAVVLAVIAALVLPQAVHVFGILTGSGSALGTALLPMHISVFIVGLYAGAAVGGIAGALSPAFSFLLTGMPAYAAMPFMCAELAAYGTICGALRRVKIPVVFKVLIAQVGGRAIKWCVLFAVSRLFGGQIAASSVWTATVQGLVGIALQLILIPMFAVSYKGKACHE